MSLIPEVYREKTCDISRFSLCSTTLCVLPDHLGVWCCFCFSLSLSLSVCRSHSTPPLQLSLSACPSLIPDVQEMYFYNNNKKKNEEEEEIYFPSLSCEYFMYIVYKMS
ncbi:hypothetical protein AMELA_G00000560, partial [Ameiurus melas]